MSDELPRRRSIDSVKKEAKRWLDAIRTGTPDSPARARLERAVPNAPANPTLRDVQHALARDHGFSGWTALKEAIEQASARDRETGARALSSYEAAAAALLDAYRVGTPEAMEQHYRHTWHRRPWLGMRTYVQLDLGKRPAHQGEDVEITLDDARRLVAIEHGFASWDALSAFTESSRMGARVAVKPVRLVDADALEESRPIMSSRDWAAIIRALETHPYARLCAEGQMTDSVLADVAAVESVTALDLGGSRALTDEGLRHLARLPRLEHLDVSGTGITNRCLDILRELPALRTISLAGTRVTDAGVAQLAHCERLESVSLQGTQTGDGAIRALAGKHKLRW